jgi:flavin-dependent dehydrogenase
MRIGIIGARLSGSYASLLLARMGHEILLFDPGTEKEKPCGGGVTPKALQKMSWFQELRLPYSKIDTLLLLASDGYKCRLPLRRPMRIFSRRELDSLIRDAALQAGAGFLPQKATRFIAQNHGWVISTASQSFEIDFLIGADGAASSVRSALIGKCRSSDLVLALGYYLPGVYHPHTAVAAFQEHGFPGYLWSFPRVDHSSIGIGCRLPEVNAKVLRHKLLEFISVHYPDAGKEKRFYAARIPCLGRRSLINQRVCGPNWALVGDAAGFADAITSEGIYFALRSAELLADAVSHGAPLSYENAWRRDFGKDLLTAAEWRDWFYAGRFLCHAVTRRATQAIRHSKTTRRIVNTLIGGNCTYESLRRQMILRIPRILVEVLISRLAGGMKAPENRAEF